MTFEALPSGNLALNGRDLIRVFSPSGRLLDSWRPIEGSALPGSARRIVYLESFDRIFSNTTRSSSQEPSFHEGYCSLYDRSGQLILTLAYTRTEGTFRRGGDAGGNNYGVLWPWFTELQGTVNQQGRIYWTRTDSLGFWSLDLTDGSYFRAVIEAPSPRLTAAEIDSVAVRAASGGSRGFDMRWYRWFKGLDFPAVRPWTDEIHTDDAGRVWLREHADGLVAQPMVQYSGIWVMYFVFSPEGFLLGTVRAPTEIIRITRDEWYAVERAPEFHNERIHRYLLRR